MNELREIILRILETYDKRNKYASARQLAEALELVDTESMIFKMETVLGRRLSKQEAFKVETLGLIMRDKNMFDGGDSGECDATKTGL